MLKKSVTVLAVLFPLACFAQSSPRFFYGEVPTPGQWNSYFSSKLDYVAPSDVGNVLLSNGSTWYSAALAPELGKLPVQTIAGATHAFTYTDFYHSMRRINNGMVMTDTLPAASATGMADGAQINITNADALAADLITAGSGTTLEAGEAGATAEGTTAATTATTATTAIIAPGRNVWWTYDSANAVWRVMGNSTASVLYSGTPPAASQLYGGSDIAGNAKAISTGACLNLTGNILSSACTGTVTGASVVNANGFGGAVTNSTTNPAISITTSVSGILKGDGTAASAAVAGADYAPPTSGSAILYGNGMGGTANASLGANLAFSAGLLAMVSAPTVAGTNFSAIPSGALSGVNVAQGGTGRAALAANGLLVGQGISAVNSLSAGLAGQVLMSNGAGNDPSFQPASAALYQNLMSVTRASQSGTGSFVATTLSADVVAGGSYSFEIYYNGCNAASCAINFNNGTAGVSALTGLSTSINDTLWGPSGQLLTYAATYNANNAGSGNVLGLSAQGVINVSASGTFIPGFMGGGALRAGSWMRLVRIY